MTEKKIGDMTDEELTFLMGSTRPDTPLAEQLKLVLQFRMGKRQAESADALVAATQRLVDTTGRLGWAPWGLMGATLVLVAAEIVLKLLGRA